MTLLPSAAVVFSASAFGRIEAECLRSAVETGGLLIGRQVYDNGKPVLVVLEVTGPGARADRRTVTYAPDSEDLDRELASIRVRHGSLGVDYVGEWHKHPIDLTVPSSGDLRQARSILASADYHLPHGEVLIPIATIQPATGFALRAFVLRRGGPSWVEFEPLKLTDGDARLLLEAGAGAPTSTVVSVASPASTEPNVVEPAPAVRPVPARAPAPSQRRALQAYASCGAGDSTPRSTTPRGLADAAGRTLHALGDAASELGTMASEFLVGDQPPPPPASAKRTPAPKPPAADAH
jgi:integrative and conjugative element protein (TIGR02256 family)